LIDPLVFINSSYNSTGNWSFTIKFTNVVAGEIYEQTLTEPIGNNILGNVTPSLYFVSGVGYDERISFNDNVQLASRNTSLLKAQLGTGPAKFYVSNGTYTTLTPPVAGTPPNFNDPNISEQLLVTVSKMEVATQFDINNEPVNSSFVEYKPINSNVIWSEYISIVGSNATGYSFQYNSNFTRVDIRGYQAGDNLNGFSNFYQTPTYNGVDVSTAISAFRVTVKLQDANGGPQSKSIETIEMNSPVRALPNSYFYLYDY
jgi:hypothetical protein